MMFRKNRLKSGIQKADWFIVAAGLMVFIGITLWTITKSSIWFDESFGAYLIRFNFFDIALYTASDVHPPFYYWILKLWSAVFGNSELGLRSMSLMFGCISIVIGYLLSHRLFGQKAARMSLMFMVLSPMFVRYSQEARMYTLVTAIALAATYVLTYAVTTKKKLPWVIYGVLVSLGMWTHYFSAVVWIAHWIWRADVIRRVTKKGKFIKSFFTKEWILSHAIAVGLYLPWLPFMVNQLFVVQAYGFWIPPVTPGTPVNFLTNVVYYQDVNYATGWLAFWLIIAVTLIGILTFRVYKILNEAERQSYRLIAALAFAPIVLLFLLSMPPLRSSFVDRYLITSALMMSVFIGVTLSLSGKFIKSKYRNVAAALIVLMMVIGINYVWYWGNYNKTTNTWNGTRLIIDAVKSKAAEGQPIIAANVWVYYNAAFYSTNSHEVFFIDPVVYQYGSTDMLKNNDFRKIKTSQLKDFTQNHPIFWYVGSGEGELEAPYSDWKPIQELRVTNPITGKTAYRAIQYEIFSK